MITSSSKSNLRHNSKDGWPVWLVLALTSVISMGGYLLVSAVFYRTGFPLDDAWIHQTYARNLAYRGEWAFFPGIRSGGSTAPLWTVLLAVGFLIRLAPYVWTYLLGAMALWGISLLGEKAIRQFVPSYHPRIPWVGIVLAFEWHLAWSAGSGMETLLYALLVTTVLVLVISGSRKFTSMGFLIGLSVWVRPDGVTLLGPAILIILLNQSSWTKRIRGLINLGVGFGSLFTFYLLFNEIISGTPLPNTFYAKQAEYAVYLQLPFLARLGSEMLQPLIGAGVILLPGFIFENVTALRKKAWGILAAGAWLMGFLCLYAWRLPVTYQHGRYIIPAMPIFFLLALAGLVDFVLRPSPQRTGWFFASLWKLGLGAVLVIFYGRGAFAYAQDVAVIESEMVVTAKWVANHVPPGSLVAAHDIGALGYFGKHELVDLAGLISPDVIPFLRDEKRMATYLTVRGAAYLVAFPDWFPSLTSNSVPVFTTGAPYAPALGEKNMAVYRWPGP